MNFTQQTEVFNNPDAGASRGFQRNLAFIIGIDNYQNGISKLNTAVNDAKKLVEVLRSKHQYQVWVCLDSVATLSNLNKLLEETLPEQVTENDRLLFYFAGHGVVFNKDDNGPVGYLIPQDAKLGDTNSYLSMTKLHSALNELPCRHFLGILDCCFAGAFRWSSTRDLITSPEIIYRERYDRFIRDAAWQIITSSASDQKALDNFNLDTERGQVGNHSPFATALFEALEGAADASPPAQNGKPAGDGVITANELYTYLRNRVEISTEKYRVRQTPGIWYLNKHDKGEYIFLSPNHELNLPPAPPLDESKNPYRGLNSFEEEHSQFFFGRSQLVEELQDFVKINPLTVVLGASGSGKSSLVKAGLIPKLKQENNNKWCILPPIRPGETPFQALNQALVSAGLTSVELQDKQKTLAQSIDIWAKKHPNSKLLIFIDQSEEIITLCSSENERKEFFQQILTAINAHRHILRVVLTLRSDFEPQLQSAGLKYVPTVLQVGDTVLKNRWQSGKFRVPIMKREELREAIEKPAQLQVMYFQPHDLVEQLIDEVADMPGALPLLSFALSELFLKYLKRQRYAQYTGQNIDRALTQADYQELGGVMQSLTERADEEYQTLVQENPAYEQIIRHVMLRMIAISGGELARRRVPLSELEYPPEKNSLVKQVIEQFTRARLLVEGQDAEGNPYVEPAHDALVKNWEKLTTWKRKEEENLILQRRLTPAAEEWKKIKDKEKQPNLLVKVWGQAESVAITKMQTRRLNQQRKKREANNTSESSVKSTAYLWDDDPRLDQLNQVLSTDDNWLNWIENNFVRLSVLQRGKNTYRFFLVLTGVIVSLTGLSIFALVQLRYSNLREKAATVQNELYTNPLSSLVLAIQATGENNSFVWQLFNPVNSVKYSLSRAVAESREQLSISAHQGNVNSVAFSPNGQTIVSGGEDGTIRLWDLKGKQINSFITQVLKGVNSVAFSPNNDEQIIASGSDDGTVRLWNLQGQQIKKWGGHNEGVTSIAFSPNGDWVVSVSNDSVWRWNLRTNKVYKLVTTEKDLKTVAFSPNGKYIAAVGGDNIILWDINGKNLNFKQQALPSYGINNTSFSSVVFSNDSKHIYTGQDVGHGSLILDAYEVEFWRIDESTKSLIQEQGQNLTSHKTSILSLATSVNENEIIASGSTDNTIHLSQSAEEVSSILRGHTGRVRSIAFNPKQKQLVSGSEDGTIRVWDLSGYFSSSKIRYPNACYYSSFTRTQIHAIAFNPKYSGFASACDNSVILFDKQGNQIKSKFEHPSSSNLNNTVNSIAYSPDGLSIISASDDKTLRLWDLEGKKPEIIFSGHKDSVTSVAFSRDGKNIVSGSKDNTLRLWNLQGKQIQVFRGHQKVVNSVAFSPDGKMIISGSDDNTLRLWDLQGKELKVFRGHEDKVTSVAFSPDSKMIISGSYDRTLRFWNLQGELIEPKVVRADIRGIKSVGFSPDGKMVVTAGEILKFWNLDGSPVSVSFEGAGNVFAISPDSKTILTSIGMIENPENNSKWLKPACKRLRYHNVFVNPQNDTQKQARNICKAYI